LVTATSAVTFNVSVSVAELLPAVGSVQPVGTLTDAELANEPVAVDEIAAVSVYVAVPPTRRLTVSLIEPAPEAAHVEPAEATQVHVAPVSVAGKVSVTVAPVTVDGPLFVATIV
jgi:hypothetical protein